MGGRKKTLYEILGVAPTATVAEIRRAHQEQSRQLLVGGETREALDFKLQVLDVALHTLASPSSRNEYDAQIAPPILPTRLQKPHNEVRALRVAAALAESERVAAEMRATQVLPLQDTLRSMLKSLAKIFRVFIGLFILAMVMRWAGSLLAESAPSLAAKRAAQMSAQEASAVTDPAELERRRKVNAEKAAALEQQKREEAERKFVEESRRMGKKVIDNLSREEARAREAAAHQAWQEAQAQRQREDEQRRQEEAERRRIAEERRKLGLPENR